MWELPIEQKREDRQGWNRVSGRLGMREEGNEVGRR